MQNNEEILDMQTLLDRYNQEIDVLKAKLINGVSWENLSAQRRIITELAIKLHKMHNHIVPEYMTGNPAEHTRLDNSTSEPVQ